MYCARGLVMTLVSQQLKHVYRTAFLRRYAMTSLTLLRDTGKHCCLGRAVAYRDCCFYAPCINILLTYLFWHTCAHTCPRGLHCSKIVKPSQSLPLQMVERLPRAQPDSVANHVTARSISDRRAVWRDWLLSLAELDVNVPPFAVVSLSVATWFLTTWTGGTVSRLFMCKSVHGPIRTGRDMWRDLQWMLKLLWLDRNDGVCSFNCWRPTVTSHWISSYNAGRITSLKPAHQDISIFCVVV